MRYEIAICDDQQEIRDLFLDYLKRMEEDSSDSFSIQFYSSGEECLQKLRPDTQILLLDIIMDGLSGIDVGVKLRQNNDSLCIIYITSESSYALDGYRARAFNYIMKPVEYESFKNAVSDALKLAVKKGSRFITLSKGASVDKIFLKEILYIESKGHNVSIVTRTGIRKYPRALKDIAAELDPSQFIRCHQGFVINLAYVRKIGLTDIEMVNRSIIPLSRHRKKDVAEQFALFAGGLKQTTMPR